MVVGSSENWYTGTGDAPDGFQIGGACLTDCQYDAWSVTTHEWGHAFGFMRGRMAMGMFPIVR